MPEKISSVEFQLDLRDGIHDFVMAVFDEFNFCAVDLVLHATIVDWRQHGCLLKHSRQE